jgi:hypothetical protein
MHNSLILLRSCRCRVVAGQSSKCRANSGSGCRLSGIERATQSSSTKAKVRRVSCETATFATNNHHQWTGWCKCCASFPVASTTCVTGAKCLDITAQHMFARMPCSYCLGVSISSYAVYQPARSEASRHTTCQPWWCKGFQKMCSVSTCADPQQRLTRDLCGA